MSRSTSPLWFRASLRNVSPGWGVIKDLSWDIELERGEFGRVRAVAEEILCTTKLSQSSNKPSTIQNSPSFLTTFPSTSGTRDLVKVSRGFKFELEICLLGHHVPCRRTGDTAHTLQWGPIIRVRFTHDLFYYKSEIKFLGSALWFLDKRILKACLVGNILL